MPILLLIRHATNDFVKTGRLPGQSPNIHLNAEGRAQAESLGKSLSRLRLTAVYASQLERAVETAWRVAAPHGLPVRVRPALADTDGGAFTGRVIKELAEDEATKDAWKVIVEKPTEGRLPGGEALTDMQRRVVAALDRIVAEHPDPTPDKDEHGNDKPADPIAVAVVMHADPIKAALAHYLGMPFDNFQRLGVSPASVSAVMVAGKHVAVLNVNRVPHEQG